MAETLRLVLVLHEHQPVGNFDSVVEQLYRDSYLPLLTTVARWPAVRVSLHTSGPLLDWLESHHPEYVDRLAELASTGRVDILGGAYGDAILPMLPREDRIGQMMRMGERLKRRFGETPRGMWLPERVWEPTLAADIAEAGVEHTVLDDVHFQAAGLGEEQLYGYYLSDDHSLPIGLFAGLERLRYMIPFAPHEQIIGWLRRLAKRQPGATVVYADDGEKFGGWPGMREHCFEQGWLSRFFEALSAESDWLRVTTLREVVDRVPPLGKVYVPDGSYREMNEWSTLADITKRELPVPSALRNGETHEPTPPVSGTWRNFRVKYPAANEMIARMMLVSRRLRDLHLADRSNAKIAAAQRALDRAQCGCAYWHGIFGGVYLPHLRQAVYRHLIEADNLLDDALDRRSTWVEATLDDFDADIHREIMLSNDQMLAFLAPERGGMLYELDLREPAQNILATFARRPEPYHAPTPDAGAPRENGQVLGMIADTASTLLYDAYPRKSLIDHFWDEDTRLADVVTGSGVERGDFVQGRYEHRLRRSSGRISVEMSRTGTVNRRKVRVIKTVSLAAGAAELEIKYQIDGLAPRATCHFGVEFNVAGPVPELPFTMFNDAERPAWNDVGHDLELHDSLSVTCVDRQSGYEVVLECSRETDFWLFPIHTRSRSQTGLEWIHQSMVLLPHWQVEADDQGRWQVGITLAVRTQAALTGAASHAGAATRAID